MPDKFNNRYRIPSARLQAWDYGSNGSYFITICTKDREHFFGKIMDGKMQWNETGKLAEQYWMEIPNHFPFIELGNFVVMPNHVHGILIIDKNAKVDNANIRRLSGDPVETPKLGVSTSTMETSKLETPTMETSTMETPKLQPPPIETPKLGVSTDANANNNKSGGGKNEHWKPGTIGVIINQYKRVCTINARKTISHFAWQSRFHDHIIRDSKSFETIQNYIAYNPMNWEQDLFYF